MASKRNLKRKKIRVCQNKKRYSNRTTALRVATATSDRLMTRINPYICEICGFYHIGHPDIRYKDK